MHDSLLINKNTYAKISRKVLFEFIKAYKRYYLGSLLYFNFYRLIGNKHKSQKWQQKHKSRHRHLLQLKYFYTKIKPQIKSWTESKEFKEKYIDANHPYPPLLNLQNMDYIDYESISADLAWELNLPLPPNYDFLYISSGAAASAATFKFFTECRVNINDAITCKGLYEVNYNTFLQHRDENNCFFSYCYYMSATQESLKLRSLLRKKPLLFIVRDPIERLQHAINHLNAEGTVDHIGVFKGQNNYNINLTCHHSALFKTILYESETTTPNLTLLDSEVSYKLNRLSLYNTTTLNDLKDKTTSIHCIEFNDLKPEKAFDTFCNLADTLGFERPTNKEIFTNRVNRNRGALITLPTTLYAHPDDLPNAFKEGKEEKRDLDSLNKKGGFSIIVTLPHYVTESQKDFADISDDIYPNLIIDDTKILIIIDKDELAQLKENTELFNTAKIYLKGYINALIDNANKIKASLITESQILEYLRQNDKSRKQIKNILDLELNYIKTHHPDFIQKWKYYLEFEKMCAELDDENLNRRQK